MRRGAPLGLVPLLLAPLLTGCDDMVHQPKRTDYSNAAVAPAEVPAGTFEYESRKVAPPPLSLALLERGQARYRIFCTPCHGERGDGRGMVVQRGFPAPPSYHIARLRAAPPAHVVDVITDGYGVMASFASRVPPADRWAIAAYIRALQRSQEARLADLSPGQRAALP
jgi:mono/diheme cytochrome c family protein